MLGVAKICAGDAGGLALQLVSGVQAENEKVVVYPVRLDRNFDEGFLITFLNCSGRRFVKATSRVVI